MGRSLCTSQTKVGCNWTDPNFLYPENLGLVRQEAAQPNITKRPTTMGYFAHFKYFGGILVIFLGFGDILVIFRFQGYFGHFFGFRGYFGHFLGLEVFW